MAEIVTKVGIEENGKVIVPPGKFEEIASVVFDSGEASDKLFTAIDDTGRHLLLIDANSDEGYLIYGSICRLSSIDNDCIVVSDYDERHGEKWAIIETNTLAEITDYEYDLISPINENMYMTKKEGLYGVIDKDGIKILENSFTEISFDNDSRTFKVTLYDRVD